MDLRKWRSPFLLLPLIAFTLAGCTAAPALPLNAFAIGTAGADAFSGATGEEATGEEIYVDGITGATVTSKAVARCVNSAIAYVTGADVESSATSWGG